MDGLESQNKMLSFNLSANAKPVSAINPNISWVYRCANGSCQISTQPGRRYSTAELVLLTIFTCSLSLVTVLGNVLVMLSIIVNKQLQTVNNYFLFSLACADLIIGLISMNFYSLYIIMGYWPLGAVVCDTWLALDYAVSNASVMNLLIISFDRYFCVTRPLTYPARRTTWLVGLMITAAWVLSVLLWVPAILCWQYVKGKRIVPDGECYIQLLASPAVTLGTTLPSFYLPAAIMIFLYTRICLASRSRLAQHRSESRRMRTSSGLGGHGYQKKKRYKSSETMVKSDSARVNEAPVEAETSMCPNQRGSLLLTKAPIDSTEKAKTDHTCEIPSPVPLLGQTMPMDSTAAQPNGAECNTVTTLPQPSPLHNGSTTCASKRTLYAFRSSSESQSKRKRQIKARERKVTKTIFAILLAFIITWTPYSVMAIIGTFCHFCVSDTMWTIGYWLCYINSTINPVCYALCNLTFRNTFRNLLGCRCKNLGRI